MYLTLVYYAKKLKTDYVLFAAPFFCLVLAAERVTYEVRVAHNPAATFYSSIIIVYFIHIDFHENSDRHPQ